MNLGINPEITEDMLSKPEKYIPDGMYCHGRTRGDICPFWDYDKDIETNTHNMPWDNGYCHYLKLGDWDINAEAGKTTTIIYSKDGANVGKTAKELTGEDYFSVGLLWDQCKECGINDEWEE